MLRRKQLQNFRHQELQELVSKIILFYTWIIDFCEINLLSPCIGEGTFSVLLGKPLIPNTAWKVFLFGVILVRIFLHSDWIRKDTPCSVRIRENTDQNNSECEHFLRSESLRDNISGYMFYECYQFGNNQK